MAALIGGLLTAFTIYGLAWRRGVHGFRLVLVGIGLQAMLLAIVHWLLVVAEVFEAARAYVWLNGSLNARGWEHVVPVSDRARRAAAGRVRCWRTSSARCSSATTPRAASASRSTGRASLLLLVAVGLASVATAAAGPIAFVALVAPQIAQRLVAGRAPADRDVPRRRRPR